MMNQSLEKNPFGGRQVLGLKYYRLKTGLLQYHAAQAIGVHVSRLAKMERGILKPRGSELAALAKLYGVETPCLTQPCELFLEPQRGPEGENLKDYRDRAPGRPKAKPEEPRRLGQILKEVWNGKEPPEKGGPPML